MRFKLPVSDRYFPDILELIKESLIELIQTEPYEPIHVKPRVSPMESVSDDE